MQVALISDIHGHDIALEAVLADIARQEVDSIICLGDVATIGPQPRQVLNKLKSLGCVCILGNHDAALLELDKAVAYHIAQPLIPTLHWCAGLLGEEEMVYLRSFRPFLPVPLEDGTTMLCFHGSPYSNIDTILPTTPDEEITRLLGAETAVILAGGHTHIQMLRQYEGKLIVNPGSVGSAFPKTAVSGGIPTLLPWAEYAIVTAQQGGLSVDLRRVPFDIAAFRATVSASDIPIKNWWLQQYT